MKHINPYILKKVWLLGFGFFSISITWSLYNAFVPFFLEKYVHSVALISFMICSRGSATAVTGRRPASGGECPI
ncbi:hypothetical protein D3C85_1218300 [compost metagenome]